MGCDFPIKAYRSTELDQATGKRLITFNPLKAVNSTSPFEIPCNQCTGCRLERSRQWAVRMMHESKFHDLNAFITLTYDGAHCPVSLDLRHFQLFMKRLRKSLPQRVRFFACGEYGPQLLRPHYHAILFGHDFSDKKLFSKNQNNEPIYVSQQLTDLWGMGFTTTSDVTFKSAAYVARYTLKKINGDRAVNHYQGRKPEFSVMSRRPGIGTSYVEKYKEDFYPSGFIVVNGVPQAPPRFYTSKLTEEEQDYLKRQSRARSLQHKAHNTTERRWARVRVRDARISRLKRTFEG